ncbi:N-acetyltransferase [Yeosuana aromativorans]|uniref:N-acetyltransferase n=1 Tax=Yeosuana aromativorans TaxID=288019 RepID=A0A8J3BIC0_9FLAO|nr:GNAT family N-acetyltransferase [Yeosuana aromativorans]GGK24335.1 N-acetyltransferase [Yeosuana aromativorans]
MKLVRTNSENPDFINLVKDLDAYLKVIDGDEHAFYKQYNNIDVLKHTVVAYLNEKPVGCGAFKKFDKDCVEIKRMFTDITVRGKGIATKILSELEIWASELNYKSCILETGIRQVEAVNFYKKNQYTIIPNYGQYINISNSLCFKKML